ncbi:uncharacterized protein EI90DRAFT_3079022 [Cantharellus anzutake]|uniref:uncharacterized protein n=1 Tax=Cantharellus anzutake TaxID=1750568 RepID=UPI0019044DB9|nr:uncharacterized protein EI90DRAFT_3079022 [Cantharellus anzutake]KAF8321868.1 hypothetical protein EI90DRAFT_3079022 [Cantharellus anzutake]
MRIECIACPMTISSEVKRSARARECLREVKRLAEPGRAWIAQLPKTRKFLLDLQSILEDSMGQSVAEGGPTQPTAALPVAALLQAPHMLESQAPTDLPNGELPTTAVSANYIDAASAVNGPPHAFPVEIEVLPGLQTQTLPDGPASIDPTPLNMTPLFSQFNPNPEMTFHFENSNLVLDSNVIQEDLAGPSRSRIVDPEAIVAAFETPDRQQDRWLETNSNEDVVYWLRGLAQRLGYLLVPL